jgi:hypothetical protein
VIDGQTIHRAERRLTASGIVGIGNKDTQFARARVKREDYERFLEHHHITVQNMFRKALGIELTEDMNLDPALEGIVYTMMTHFFLTGALAAREDQEQ